MPSGLRSAPLAQLHRPQALTVTLPSAQVSPSSEGLLSFLWPQLQGPLLRGPRCQPCPKAAFCVTLLLVILLVSSLARVFAWLTPPLGCEVQECQDLSCSLSHAIGDTWPAQSRHTIKTCLLTERGNRWEEANFTVQNQRD